MPEIDAGNRDDVESDAPAAGSPAGYPQMWFSPAPVSDGGTLLDLNPTSPDRVEYLKLPISYGDDTTLDQIAVWNTHLVTRVDHSCYRLYPKFGAAMTRACAVRRGWVCFVPDTELGYAEYAPMYHLLAPQVRRRVGLPDLGAGRWPVDSLLELAVEPHLPAAFTRRLADGWARTIWNRLDSGSGLSAFSRDDPIKLLAHNLDFWVPAAHEVTARMVATESRPSPDAAQCVFHPGTAACLESRSLGVASDSRPLTRYPSELLRQAEILQRYQYPTPGAGRLWDGHGEARRVVDDIVEVADRHGRLRDILAAVRAGRVQDDFSDRMSNAKIDFERRLHGRRRDRVQVRFVELEHEDVLQSVHSNFDDRLVINEFLALLDAPNRTIVVLLERGWTRSDIATELGFADTSPISRRLARIRQDAETFFGLR